MPSEDVGFLHLHLLLLLRRLLLLLCLLLALNSWKCILGWKIKVHLEGKHNRIDERLALKTADVLMLFNVLVH